ncbi:MAG: lytic transglycosylase domain-containing protein [Actinomycetota bacterium]|nr:lytic transglycosylase domain-containing protein [Actinomycetota bacterium]
MKKLSVGLVAALAACSTSPAGLPSAGTSSPASTSTTTSIAPSPSRSEETGGREQIRFPGPDVAVPPTARGMARALLKVSVQLPQAIDEWLDGGGVRLSRAGRRIALGGLWQQKLYRSLVVRERLRAAVLRRVPSWLARRIRRYVHAGAGLRALASPVKPPVRLKTTPPTPHRALRRFYRAGARRFDVPWYVLASVNFVESKFGRLLGPSSAGARGPMQFIPATWDAYGNGGNIMDPRDSIIAAARYLSASGAPEDMRGALLAYNHSSAYVDAILIYAREMRRDPRNFYALYFWQVFVRTTRGDMQLTGPGRDRRG